MGYKFENLPQLVDKREGLKEIGEYSKRVMSIRTRVWHHSLTKKHLGGSDAASFAVYHVDTLGWPGVGYALIIEPKNVINTPKGKRARIVYAHDINRRTYHVGNSNQFSLGICVAGDYRYDKLDDATKASIDELQAALVADRIGNEDKAHQEMPGYGWKACCVFNYMDVFKFLDGNVTQDPLPDTYKIQEGDTLWSIANGIKGLSVDDLLKANPGVDPKKLKIGQKIKLGAAKPSKPKPPKPSKPSSYKGNSIVDYLKSIGESTSTSNRRKLAKEYGVNGYDLSAKKNLELLDKMRSGKKASKPKPSKPKPKFNLPNATYYVKSPQFKGSGVRTVQEALASIYFYPEKGAKNNGVDGYYGNNTADAVRRFQSVHGLKQDGSYGPKTKKVLEKEL